MVGGEGREVLSGCMHAGGDLTAFGIDGVKKGRKKNVAISLTRLFVSCSILCSLRDCENTGWGEGRCRISYLLGGGLNWDI